MAGVRVRVRFLYSFPMERRLVAGAKAHVVGCAIVLVERVQV